MSVSKILVDLSVDAGSAFAEDGGYQANQSHEVVRILRKLADRIDSEGLSSIDEIGLMDINGNRVGTARTV